MEFKGLINDVTIERSIQYIYYILCAYSNKKIYCSKPIIEILQYVIMWYVDIE